ncbi:MAG: hypothetical protein ABIA04_05325 [Pseudomonadota bacterium]
MKQHILRLISALIIISIIPIFLNAINLENSEDEEKIICLIDEALLPLYNNEDSEERLLSIIDEMILIFTKYYNQKKGKGLFARQEAFDKRIIFQRVVNGFLIISDIQTSERADLKILKFLISINGCTMDISVITIKKLLLNKVETVVENFELGDFVYKKITLSRKYLLYFVNDIRQYYSRRVSKLDFNVESFRDKLSRVYVQVNYYKLRDDLAATFDELDEIIPKPTKK